MSLMSHAIQRYLKLPAPETRSLRIERDLPVPMRDGAVLLADHWRPRNGPEGLPTALVRTPYGRRSLLGRLIARPLAERGFQVLNVATRGDWGPDDTADPFRREREDGLDVIDWIIDQPWFGGAMVLAGPGHLGCTQWAVAADAPPQVRAMVPVATESAMSMEFMRPDGVALGPRIEWAAQLAVQERPFAMLRARRRDRRTRRALGTVPLREAGEAALPLPDVLNRRSDDPYWDRLDHSVAVSDVRVPVSLVGGWYDVFLRGQVRDFAALEEAGRHARLTVGPWTHDDTVGAAVSETLEFALPLARGDVPALRAPVRLYVMGEEAWRDFDAWPPAGYKARRVHLGAGGTLSVKLREGTAGYRYDPNDPTPAFGGAGITRGGKVDNTWLEARPDVLTFTTDVLTMDFEVVGEVNAAIWFRSSLPFADVFVRLCDVDPQGRSWNVCDGLTGVTGATELQEVAVGLWPTAYRFKTGHRIRVQVSSGAFPRYARNPGTGEPPAAAVHLCPADQEVHFDAEHPSTITLPVRTAG
jgi:uncharacterized protein